MNLYLKVANNSTDLEGVNSGIYIPGTVFGSEGHQFGDRFLSGNIGGEMRLRNQT